MVSKMRAMRFTLVFPLFFLLVCLPPSDRCWFSAAAESAAVPVNVGVVLDMDDAVGEMGLSCISMALSDFYSSHSHYKTRLQLNIRDSKDSVVGAAAASLDLLKNVQVQAIIGPVTSMQSTFVINLGNEAHVPIISFSATSPSLSSIPGDYFIRATLDDTAQLGAVVDLIRAFQWSQVVIISMDNEYGKGVILAMTNALEEKTIHVLLQSRIHPLARDQQIVSELKRLKEMKNRVFIVHMFPDLASRLFVKAEEIGMMSEGYVWIITDGIANSLNLIDQRVINSMQGVLGVRPHVPSIKRLEDFISRWKQNYRGEKFVDSDINIFGFWAYDAATALAMAVEKVGPVDLAFQKPDLSLNSTDLETIGISQRGKDLCEALSSVRFRGLSGDFHLVNGQLSNQSSAFEYVNVIGTGQRERTIGFWTQESGITRKLEGNHSTSKANFRAIIWPGDTVEDPQDLVPINHGNAHALRIAVPVKDGVSDFVMVAKDPNTNRITRSGFSIMVFEAAMAELPHKVSFNYVDVPFKTDGKSVGGMDALLHGVVNGNYDAAVADITITVNRSLYVEFTLPYTESGIKMIVPFKDKKYKNAWVFLKPLTWDLWVASVCFFVFIGFVIWILEHQINEDFNGPSLRQVGTSFWFSFSAMTIAHKEKLVSNLARFVVMVWCLVVVILIQSYTASLTSMLTVQQLEPTVSNYRDLILHNKTVGYPKGSFVKERLKQMSFSDSQLLMYKSMEDLFTAFQNRSIDAAFDEIPYLNPFVERHCSKYTMVGSTFKTAGGFGFAFPKGSRLASDVSTAIMKLMEEGKMMKIESAAWPKLKDCPDSMVSSSSLTFGSFWGLFTIVGVASSFALLIFVAMLMYEHRGRLLKLGNGSFVEEGERAR
ncbi:glutamate receptor 2.7-like [Diospyros lotus]|uniref:glutamate receptor 2.7-like n=1 Tax=Diospyros lotus TaxID=55363 RepID=UPI002254E2FB|nr:glutamate receptor 2.7-like [Diospyros lotus]